LALSGLKSETSDWNGRLAPAVICMPTWILAFSYWLHLIATIVWVGGLALMALVVWPGARAVLGPGPELSELMRRLQKRFNPLAWLSLAVLIATGLTQMSANKNYDGLLRIMNPWTVAILGKHLIVGAMIVIGLYMQLGVQPELARLTLLEAHGRPAANADKLRRREMNLTRLNLLCGVLVLGLTAIARVL
jgi:uncharacterized membrane protein